MRSQLEMFAGVAVKPKILRTNPANNADYPGTELAVTLRNLYEAIVFNVELDWTIVHPCTTADHVQMQWTGNKAVRGMQQC
jgi:hypothetical protein